MSEIKTSAIVLPIIINTALKLGVNIRGILRQLGISINLEHITQSIIDLKQIHALIKAVKKATGHPAFGLLEGEEFLEFEYLPHFKSFIMSASTMREAFKFTSPIQKLISPIFLMNLEETGKIVRIKLKAASSLSDEDEQHYAEILLSSIKTLTNRLMRKTIPPRAVHFRHGRSEVTPFYAGFFGSTIVLNAPENTIIYDRAIMDIPLPGGFPEIHQQAEKVLKQQIAHSPLHGGPAEDIKRLLATHGDLFNATIDQVARSLNMSTRTLQRRLAENAHSFAEIRDQIRFELAAEALKSERQSIIEIGYNLGFSDPHSFLRAFKRWSGLTPGAYRRNFSL